MRKLFLALGLGVGCIVLFTACNKDDSENGSPSEPLNAEQNKELMQDIGVEFVNEMATMQELEAVGALTSFGVRAEDVDEGGRIASSSPVKVAKVILGFTYQKASALEFGYASARVSQDDDDEFTSLQELFEEYAGTYTWNFTNEEFDYANNSADQVIFNYPAEEDGTTNNATLIFSDYTGIAIANPIDEDYEGDLPTSLKVTLEVDGQQVMSYGFEIEYNDEGIPVEVNTNMSMNDYALTVGIINNTSIIGYSANFSNGSKTLLAVSTEVEGNFTEEALDAADESEDPTEVVTDGSFSLTLLDIKFSSELDFVGLYNEIGDLALSYDSLDEARPDLESNAAKLETALNTHGTLQATYVSTGQVAADVEFYTFVEKEQYSDYTEEWIALGARMVFEDESKVDVQDFVESGFDGLEDAINDLIDQINSDLDAADWIEHVDFSDIG